MKYYIINKLDKINERILEVLKMDISDAEKLKFQSYLIEITRLIKKIKSDD